MHLGLHNLISLGNTKAQQAARRSCALLTIVVHLFTATPAHAKISAGGALKFPEVLALVALIKATNDAMAQASLNPQNKNYRENVRRAVSMLPGGIIAVAGVFKAGKMHDSDLPVVQAMLGGFVDVSAPERYKSFFKDPDPSLIPKLGSEFPKDVKPANISAPAPLQPLQPGQAPAVASAPAAAPVSNDIVSLKDRWAPNNTKPDSQKSYGYDEGNKKQESEPSSGVASETASGQSQSLAAASNQISGSPGTGNVGATGGFGYEDGAKSKASEGGGFTREMSAEFSSVESRVSASLSGGSEGSLTVNRVIASAPNELTREKENFFAKGKQAKDVDGDELLELDEQGQPLKKHLKKKRLQPGDKRASAQDYRLPVKPKYWKFTPLSNLLESLLITEARAEGCESCGSGEGGSKAAEILMAIAAIIAAIAPMVVAGIQAEADKAIAKINADTTLKTAQMQADTSKFLANTQKDVALQQAAISQSIAKQNNDAQSQRLNMQLAELRSAREDAQKAEKEKREIEMQYNQERIALAKKQADDNLKLAKTTLNANLTQAGLVSGVVSKNSANSLSVAKAGLSTSPARSNSATGTGAQVASSGPAGLGGGGGGLPETGGIPESGGTGLGVRSTNLTTTLTSSRAADRLLSAVAPNVGRAMTEEEKEKEEQEELKRHNQALRSGRLAKRGRAASSSRGASKDEQRVSTQLASNVATGSSPGRGFKVAAVGDGKNDLADFKKEFAGEDDWYRPHSSGRAAVASTGGGGGHSGGHKPPEAGRGVTGAYRAPSDVGSGE